MLRENLRDANVIVITITISKNVVVGIIVSHNPNSNVIEKNTQKDNLKGWFIATKKQLLGGQLVLSWIRLR
jgi:hypothetical protein